MKSDESTPRIIQSLLVHWSQTNPTIASHAHVLGGSSRVPAPLRVRDKPLLTSAWETNPTTHLSIKPRWKFNCAGKVWDELSNYKTLLRVVWEIFTQRRVTRIFLVKNLKYFSIRLFLFQNNSKFFRRATTFYHRPPEKSCSFNHTRLLPPKIVPHNKYAYSKSNNQTCVYLMQSTIKKAHPTKIQEIQPADNFFSTNVNSSLFCLNYWRAVTYPSLFSDKACDSLLDWCNSYHFKP